MRKKEKQKKSVKEKSVREKIGAVLDMPLDMIKDCSRMTVIGNENILLENYKGIIEYEENIIRLSNNINIFGDKLNIEEITDDDILITGYITNIEFEN